MVALRGTVRARGVLAGTVSPSMTLPRYPGPYDVTPAADAQVLATKGLAMSADVAVGGMGEAIEKAERDAMRSIVDGSFEGVYRDEEVTEVRAGAFQACTGLTEVNLPALTTMTGSSSAFQACTGLTEVNLPALTTMTGARQFQGCTALEEISIPCRYLMDNSYTFLGCTSLRKVVLPNSTHDDGWHIFYGCTALRCIDLGCKGTFYADLPDSPQFDTLILRDPSGVYSMSNYTQLSATLIANGTGYIYVPRALVDKYKAATNWSVYADQFRAIEDYPDICDPD